MATSITLNSDSYEGRYLQLKCVQTKDIANNRSTVTWTLSSIGGSSPYYSTGATTVVINGTTVYSKSRVNWDAGVFPAAKGSVSGTTIVNHNATTGAATISISLSTAIYTSSITTKTSSWTLDTIQRASTITCADTYIGDMAFININKQSSSFTTSLYYSFGSLSNQTIATGITAASYIWLLPAATLYPQIPNAKSGTCTLTAKTYSGSTLIGTKTTTFKIMCKESSCKPIFAAGYPIVSDSNDTTYALTGSRVKLIKGYSNAAIQFGASAVNSATLSSKTLVNGSKSLTADGTINKVDSGSFVFTLVDSRGFSTVNTITRDFINYVPLTCGFTVANITTTGNTTLTVKGDYWVGNFGASNNSLTLTFKYKEEGGSYSSPITLTPTLPTGGNTAYTATYQLTELDYEKNYVFTVSAVDALNTINTAEITVSSIPVFDFDKDDFRFNTKVNMMNDIHMGGEGICDTERAIRFNTGSVEEGEYQHNCKLFGGNPATASAIGMYDSQNARNILTYRDDVNRVVIGNLNSQTYVNNMLLADFVVAQGTSNGWTYRKWNNGTAECWKSITGTTTNAGSWQIFKIFNGSDNFPSGLFITNPTVEYNAYIGSGYAINARGGLSDKTTFRWACLGTDGASNIGYTVDAFAVGKWK